MWATAVTVWVATCLYQTSSAPEILDRAAPVQEMSDLSREPPTTNVFRSLEKGTTEMVETVGGLIFVALEAEPGTWTVAELERGLAFRSESLTFRANQTVVLPGRLLMKRVSVEPETCGAETEAYVGGYDMEVAGENVAPSVVWPRP